MSMDYSSDWSSSSFDYSSDSGRYSPTSPDYSSRLGQYSPRPKKRRTFGEDRLSALPDSLIHHILSFLPAKYAIKTGVLSTRWRNLWTAVPRLSFRYHGSRNRDFLGFIANSLLQYSASKIQELALNFHYYMDDKHLDPNIASCLSWARVHQASEIRLELYKRGSYSSYLYVLPQFFFDNPSLTRLYTRSCLYTPKEKVSWGSIRSLTIGETRLNSHRLEKILLGCPLLESLELYNCWDLDNIGVRLSPKLRFLEVFRCWPFFSLGIDSCSTLETLVLEDIDEGATLEIDCPSLKNLKILGRWKRFCRLLNVSSLINAYITFQVSDTSREYRSLVEEMFRQINHAEQITLGPCFIQGFSAELRVTLSPGINLNCRCLTLQSNFNEWSVFLMTRLLQYLPTLQKLVVDMSMNDSGKKFLSSSVGNVGDLLQKDPNLSSSCLLGHLKTFEIVYLDPEDHLSRLVEFTHFLLKNARVLEKMVVFFREHSPYCDIYEVQEKLWSIPRSSPHAVLLFYPYKG